MRVRASRSVVMVASAALLVLGLTGCGQGQERASAEGTGAEQAGGAPGSAARSGATENTGPPAARPYEPLGRMVVTRDSREMPPGCGPQQAAGLMTHFLDAYNRGDQKQLKRLFRAKWELTPWLYAMARGSKVEVGVDNREALLRYFAKSTGATTGCGCSPSRSLTTAASVMVNQEEV